MRSLILILAAAVPLAAATTTVTQTIVGPDGQPGSGVAYIRITAPCSYGGSYVGEKTITVKFAPSGSPPATTFSVALVPNVGTNGSVGGSGACAGTSYTVSWAFAGGPVQPAETWVVPVSATPVTVDAVKTGPLPAPASQINPSQISAGGGTVGQAMCLTVSGWAAGVCGGGVPSVFGRTGTVTAASGDYTASQVGLGNVTNDAQLKASQLVTTVGNPGSDANVPSEKAVRSAIPAVPVASVFGRTGSVAAASGDYAFGQISGSVAASQLPAVTGDVNTTAGTAETTVVAIQGKPVANTSPVDGQMMRWNAGAGAWQPVQVRYAVPFTGQTTVTVLGATHKLGTSDVTVSWISADIPPMNIEPDGWITDPVTFDVTIKFSVPLSGRCVLR